VDTGGVGYALGVTPYQHRQQQMPYRFEGVASIPSGYAGSGEQACDQRDQYGQGQAAAGEGGARRIGRGDRGSGRHGRDALEQDLTQTDGVTLQSADRVPRHV